MDIEAERNKIVLKYLNKYKNNMMKSAENAIAKAKSNIYPQSDAIYQQISKTMQMIYDNCIDQFYSTPPTVYQRNECPPPWTTTVNYGIDLYRGNNFKYVPGSYHFKPSYGFEDMQGTYKFNTPAQVGEAVVNGIRFPAIGSHDAMEWKTTKPISTDSLLKGNKGFFSIKFGAGLTPDNILHTYYTQSTHCAISSVLLTAKENFSDEFLRQIKGKGIRL